MTSADPARAASALDLGLLAPGRAGSRVETETGDGAYLQGLLDAEAALARAQAALGLIPAAAAAAITAAAQAENFDLRELALSARGGGNPVIPLVGALRAAVGAEHAGYVHRGATSQDIMDTATMLVADRAREVCLADLDRVAAALARLAALHRDTPMAGRTLTQHAVPTTFGLKVAGWRSLVLDARDRLAGRILPAQIGGAAGTLAALIPADEAHSVFELVVRYAAEAGLDTPELPWHVLRTPIAELGGALALTAGALGKFAADVLVLGRTEIGEIASRTGGAGGSSAMPHKANPVNATLIASAARQVPALASVLYASMVAEDERPSGAWHAEWSSLREALRQVGTAAELAADLAEGLEARPDRMAANLALSDGLIVSERLVGELEPLLGRETARAALSAATQTAAQTAGQEATSFRQALGETPEISALIDAKQITEDDLVEWLDPAGYLGAAADLVDHALNRLPRTGKTRTSH